MFRKENVNPNLVKIVLFILDSGCSKHMTGNLKLLINFVEKFLGTVKFRNDQIVPILGYGDLVQGAVTIKRVYYVEGLNHNLFSVGQFCDADLEVAFRKSTCYIRDLKGNDLLTEGILHQTSVARTPEQNDVVERQNRTLVEAARTMQSAAKVPLFFWAEAIATACFTQNRSLVIPRHEKTPYHIISDRKPSVKFFHIFCSLCYIVRDGENLDKMKGKGDECIFVGYSTQSRAYRVFNKRIRVIMESIHRMALEHDSLSPAIQHQANVTQEDRTVTTSNELDLLFSPMFDELLNGSSKVVSKCQVPTLAPTVTSYENINQAETYAENDQVADDEFINIFCTPVQDQRETSSRHEELYQFDRLDVWELVDRPLCTNVINLKWLWKNKRDEENTVIRNKSRIQIHQSTWLQNKHVMTSCDRIGTPMATKHLDADLSRTPIDQTKYRSKVRALMYLTASRPDIMHATCYCARYQAQPTEKHLTVVKRIFRYLKDTIHMGLWYPKDTGLELTAFSDSDHAGCLDSRKSTSGGIQFLGGDKLVSWSSKKQDCTSMSSVEAGYVSLSACCAQVIWIRTQLTYYGVHFDKIHMYYDSKAAIAISCNPIQHSCTNHIDVRYKFIKEKVEKGIVELFFFGTEYQLADLFTKALPKERFKYLVRRLVHNSVSNVLGEYMFQCAYSTYRREVFYDKIFGFISITEDYSDNNINDVNAAELEDITYFDDEDNVGAEADFNNLEPSITVSPIPTTRFHKDHPVTQIIGDLSLATQTRSMTRVVKDQGGLSQMFNDDFHTCMFACFLSQEEPKRKIWVLVDLPYGKRAIGTKWVFMNKKDERGTVIRNKARLIAQGHTQEEGIDYEEVFAPEEVYVCQPLRFEDPDHPDKVYKVVKALYGLHQAPRAWYETLANYLLENGFQRGKIDQTLFIKR
nr:retrovirus-related Pol polyprotein from transposon TNT 1-94 [Tanacetum cinerariifolium]